MLFGSLRMTCRGGAEQQREENEGGRVRDLGRDGESSFYRQGQVRVQGSWWHQLKFGGLGEAVILWAYICFISSWTGPLPSPVLPQSG